MNDKSILVVDTPKNCGECQIWLKGFYCGCKKFRRTKRPKDCPLKPLPQKKDIKHAIYLTKDKNKPTAIGYEAGWNDCLKEILGEEEC